MKQWLVGIWRLERDRRFRDALAEALEPEIKHVNDFRDFDQTARTNLIRRVKDRCRIQGSVMNLAKENVFKKHLQQLKYDDSPCSQNWREQNLEEWAAEHRLGEYLDKLGSMFDHPDEAGEFSDGEVQQWIKEWDMNTAAGMRLQKAIERLRKELLLTSGYVE